MHKRLGLIAVVALFIIIGLAIYSRVIFDGVFLFDDFEYVVNNPLIADISSTNMSDPRQIGYFTFALNYALGGEDPRGYHLFNVIVHIANSMLVLFLVRTVLLILTKGFISKAPSPLTNTLPLPLPSREGDKISLGGDDGSKSAPPLRGGDEGEGVVCGINNDRISNRQQELPQLFRHAAFLAALIFLVHPVQTQAVSYVTQRFTSLATLFYLLAVLLYLIARVRLETGKQSRPAYIYYALSLVSAVLAMKTKEISFTVPFILLMFEALGLKDSQFGKKRFIYLVPFAATLIIIPLSILGPDWGIISHSGGIAEVTRAEKLYDLNERSVLPYLFTQFRAIVVYLRILVLPLGLRVVYDFPVSQTFFEARVIMSFLFLLAIAGAALYSWKKGTAMKEDEDTALAYKLVAIGIFWFFITISVESSVIPIKDVIFEHRVYLPGVGFFMAGSVLIMRLSERLLRQSAPLLRVAVPALIIAVPLSVGAYVRNEIWTDEIKLWDDVVRKSPDKPIGYNNRGNALAKMGEYERALQDMSKTISYFRMSAEEKRKWENADIMPSNIAKTYTGRADVYIALGDYEKARADYQKAREIYSIPVDVDETLRVADMYAKKGAFNHAVEEYDKILQWAPEHINALNDRANAYSSMNRFSEAIRDFSRIIALEPGNVLAYHNRGIAYAWSSSPKKALEDFRKACSLGFKPACDSVDIVKKGRG